MQQLRDIIAKIPGGGQLKNLAESYNQIYSKKIKRKRVQKIPTDTKNWSFYFDSSLWSSFMNGQICHGSQEVPCGDRNDIDTHCRCCGKAAHSKCLKQMEVEINNNQFVCNNCNK